MTKIRADHTTYAVQPRYVSKKGGKALKGFALDISIRFNVDGTPFVQDHNSAGGTMPFNATSELLEFLDAEIQRNFDQHFVTPPSSG